MPSTINGIGTHYYGRKNVSQHDGVCRHCGRAVRLASYDTRLWFVVLFIPVIPLKRLRIMDYCPLCTRHMVMPLREWEEARQSALREGMEKMSANPDSPAAALEFHGALIAFGQQQEARELAEIIEKKFPRDIEVLLHLGAYWDQVREDGRADGCYARVLEEDAENHAARRALGVSAMVKGDLDRARQLLSFMESPGPDRDPTVLQALASAYEKQGRHQEAEQIRQTMEDVPKAARWDASPGHRRLILYVAAAAVLFVVGMLAVNFYLAGHQTLHVISRVGTPVTVAIDGKSPLKLAAKDHQELVLGEGEHKAVIAREGAPEETVNFTMTNGFLERFERRNVFVLNPLGAATLLWQQTYYTSKAQSAPEGSYRLYFGSGFWSFSDIDYPFQGFPPSISTSSGSGAVQKTGLSVYDLDPAEAIEDFPPSTSPETRMEYAEHHLKLHPEDDALLDAYVNVAGLDDAPLKRCRDFLARELDRRPVLVEWHRSFQDVTEHMGDGDKLESQYEAWLEREPEDSALLYLRGRCALEPGLAMSYYDRAARADASNPYPWRAKGYQFMCTGDFGSARTMYAEALRLKPDDKEIERALFSARLASGEHESLEADLRKALKSDADMTAHLTLLKLLAIEGRTEDARKAHEEFVSRLKPSEESDKIWIAISGWTLAYLQDDQARMQAVAQSVPKALATWFRIELCLEKGVPDEAEKLIQENDRERQLGIDRGTLDVEPLFSTVVLMSLAWDQRGDTTKSAAWRDKACARLESGSREERQLAGLLKKDDVSAAEAEGLIIEPDQKAVALVALACTSPAARRELLALASKLNYDPDFPHRFLDRTIAAMEK